MNFINIIYKAKIDLSSEYLDNIHTYHHHQQGVHSFKIFLCLTELFLFVLEKNCILLSNAYSY